MAEKTLLPKASLIKPVLATIEQGLILRKLGAYVKRLIGSIRRECLDYVIVLSEPHLRYIPRAYLA